MIVMLAGNMGAAEFHLKQRGINPKDKRQCLVVTNVEAARRLAGYRFDREVDTLIECLTTRDWTSKEHEEIFVILRQLDVTKLKYEGIC